jgi:hypothetical protein
VRLERERSEYHEHQHPDRDVGAGVSSGRMVTVDQVRSFALTLPRTTEALVRDRVKFRVGRIVYLAFSRDERTMGFAFPKEEREALVRSEPERFLMPDRSDLRYHWVVVQLDAIDVAQMRELVLDAWRMVVPKRVAAAYEDSVGWICGRTSEPTVPDRWR